MLIAVSHLDDVVRVGSCSSYSIFSILEAETPVISWLAFRGSDPVLLCIADK